jgi:hypothetical protein
MTGELDPDDPPTGDETAASRPVGASVIGCLSLVGSALGLGSLFWMAMGDDLPGRLVELGALGAAAGLSVALILALTLATGVGLFADRPWGWWVAASSFAYACIRNVGAMAQLPLLAAEFPEFSTGRLRLAMLKHLVRALFSAWFVTYLARDYVRAYYGVTDSRASAIRKVATVSLVMYGGLWFVTQALSLIE